MPKGATLGEGSLPEGAALGRFTTGLLTQGGLGFAVHPFEPHWTLSRPTSLKPSWDPLILTSGTFG